MCFSMQLHHAIVNFSSKFQLLSFFCWPEIAFPLFFPSLLCVFSSDLCQKLTIEGRVLIFACCASSLTPHMALKCQPSRSTNGTTLFAMGQLKNFTSPFSVKQLPSLCRAETVQDSDKTSQELLRQVVCMKKRAKW